MLTSTPKRAEAAECHTYDSLGRLATVVNNDGSKLTWTLDANGNRTTVQQQTGQTVTCTDPSGTGDSAVFNRAPTAVANSATVAGGSAVTFNVLSNDSDPDADALAILSVRQGSLGRAAISGASLIYTADADSAGTDQLSYVVTDGRGATASAAVTVTVTAMNHNPVANADSFTVQGWKAAVISATSNDSDPDSDPIAISSVTQGAKGVVTILPDQQRLGYAPNAGVSGADSFTYAIIDGRGGSAVGTVSATIVPNTPPTLANRTVKCTRGQSVIVPWTLDYADADGGAGALVSATTPTKGVVSIVNNVLTYTANAGVSGTDTFNYTVSDGQGGSATATITVSLTATANHAPVARNDTGVVVPINSSLDVNVLANDTDSDADQLVVTSVTVNSGPVTAVISGNLVQLITGSTGGSANVGYSISDGRGGTASASILIFVDANP